MNALIKVLKKFTSKKKLSANRGLLIYETVNDVIQAEALLKKTGFQDIVIIAPPPQYRTGCDLSIEFDLIEQVSILRTLEENDIAPMDILNISTDQLRPTDLCSIKDFGDYVMVHVGYAIQTMTEAEARSSWELFDEILGETDNPSEHA